MQTLAERRDYTEQLFTDAIWTESGDGSMIFALIIENFYDCIAIRCVTIGSTWEVQPVEIFIDDRPYAPDPAKEGQQLWITAEKNRKKRKRKEKSYVGDNRRRVGRRTD